MKIIYYILRFFIDLFYPKMEVVGLENLPKEPCVIVGNHAKMNGPIAGELRFPGKKYIWCAAEMMKLQDVPAYAFQDFWSRKPKSVRWFYKILSYIIAPVSVCVFNNAHTIGVYHDKRVVATFKESIVRLCEGANLIIFPEHDVPHNHIVCDFQEGFVEVARSYHKKTGQNLAFVPMYLARNLKKIYLGKPVCFCAENPMKEERKRICEHLMDEITQMAVALPRHKLIPYNNVSKKQYGYNKNSEVE